MPTLIRSTATTPRGKVYAAMRALRRAGYLARPNFLCCPPCGHADLTRDLHGTDANGYVFWCVQEHDHWRERKYTGPLYLNWFRRDERAAPIVRVLRAAGLKVSHRGGIAKSICVEAPR